MSNARKNEPPRMFVANSAHIIGMAEPTSQKLANAARPRFSAAGPDYETVLQEARELAQAAVVKRLKGSSAPTRHEPLGTFEWVLDPRFANLHVLRRTVGDKSEAVSIVSIVIVDELIGERGNEGYVQGIEAN